VTASIHHSFPPPLFLVHFSPGNREIVFLPPFFFGKRRILQSQSLQGDFFPPFFPPPFPPPGPQQATRGDRLAVTEDPFFFHEHSIRWAQDTRDFFFPKPPLFFPPLFSFPPLKVVFFAFPSPFPKFRYATYLDY